TRRDVLLLREATHAWPRVWRSCRGRHGAVLVRGRTDQRLPGVGGNALSSTNPPPPPGRHTRGRRRVRSRVGEGPHHPAGMSPAQGGDGTLLNSGPSRAISRGTAAPAGRQTRNSRPSGPSGAEQSP